MSLTVEIPDHILQSMQLPEQELPARVRLELAVSLYAQNILSFGKAADLANLDRFRFAEVLTARGIPRHYSEEELRRDMEYARGQ